MQKYRGKGKSLAFFFPWESGADRTASPNELSKIILWGPAEWRGG